MGEKVKVFEIRLSDLWMILKRCWWLMLAVLIVVFSGVFIYEKVTYREQYTATSTIWALGKATSTTDTNIAKALIKDYKKLILTDTVLQEVIKNQNLLIEPSELRQMIKIDNDDGTNILEISVTATKPVSAMQIANELSKVACGRINEKNTGVEAGNLVEPWEDATVPTRPSNSVSVLKIAIIALACAMAVYAVYFVLYLLDDKISTAEDVEKYLGVSLLGLVPNHQDVMRRRRSKNAYYGYSGTGTDTQSSSQRRNG